MSALFGADQYERDLARGLRLSGERADYFAAARVKFVAERCRAARLSPAQVLDFGCGIGTHLPLLAAAFPEATIVGLDAAPDMVAHARDRHANRRIVVRQTSQRPPAAAFELIFVNGVFHHVEPDQRAGVLHDLFGHLRPGGTLAIFDNNPWNPGAMWVMKRIPFDRDAKPVLARDLARLALLAGFVELETRSYFYFPRPLALLRPIEPLFARLPLGAQYAIYARRAA